MSDPRNHNYNLVEGWGRLPVGWRWGTISAVACDSKDRVYVYTRGEHPLIIFDRAGDFIDSWGEGVVQMAHGMYIDGADHVFCTDRGAHCVYQFSPAGEVVMTFGTPGKPGDDGESFDQPTDVAVTSTGTIYISDGYGNRRVHKYSSDGRRLLTWGTQGKGAGQFALPHSVRVDRYGRVWVCDRENNRIELFDGDGHYLKEWVDLSRPDTCYLNSTEDIVYVAELEYQVSIYTLEGQLINRWGGESSEQPGQFLGWPHGIWGDSHGDLYVCEVNAEGRLQKFKKA
jgi:streptogramin lyase